MTLGALAPRIGTLARRLLLPAGRGQVLARTAGAVYLQTGDGEILWIQGAEAAMHRRAVGLAFAVVSGAKVGARFCVERGSLRIAPAVTIDLAGASTWEPADPDAGAAGRPEALVALIREFLEGIDAGHSRELGSLIPALLRPSEAGAEALTATRDPVLDAAAPHAIGAAIACRALNLKALEDHARALVGLGRGLTPSGDDFIGGLLFALRRLPGLCPAVFAERACSWVDGWADRTHAISFAILADRAAGHGSATEHEIVAGLGGALSAAGPRAAAERLTGIGHSSGWDCLAGMVAAFTAKETAWTSRI